MLSPEDNKLFTSIGPGTPMGDVLRRYWHPVGCSEFVTSKPRRVKVMGEELVLYRGESGKPALMQLRCAHRSLALDYGRVEGDNLRCPYHGWLYDRGGQCLAQPAEPEGSTFYEKIRLKSYKVQELSGLVFAYMGPEPAPLLPHYDVLMMHEGVKDVQVQLIHANWFNHVENIVDVSHLAWLHGYTFPAYGAKKVTYHWERTPYGANNVMNIEGIEDTHVSCYGFPTANRFSLPPIDQSGELVRSMIFRVPADDATTHLYFVRFYPSRKHVLNTSRRDVVLGEYAPLASDWWGINVNDQDRMAVEQQGTIADRPNEHLGVSDGGIIQMRQMMRESLAAVAQGKDPLCIIRDPAQQVVDFPQKSTMLAAKREDVGYALGYSKETQEGLA
ncbi:MAG TPA: Rieske 2Fe-2S domain-containing protein [Stellaceae bacterium]|nr:Rieske 2Fe-2S domain-containing protein [Stellaceae bacterium]